MKILFLHSGLITLPGGGENFSRNFIKALINHGHEVTALAVANAKGDGSSSLPTELHLHPIRGVINRGFGQKALSEIGLVLSTSFPKLKPFLYNFQMAIAWRGIALHNRMYKNRVLATLKRSWKNFDIAYVHSDVYLAAEIADYLPTFLRLPGPVGEDLTPQLNKIHAICANGDVFSRLKISFGNRLNNIYELPIGLNSDEFSPHGENFRTKFRWGPDEIVLGYSGRIIPLKGVDLLCEAFCHLAPQYPQLRLLMVGAGEALETIRKRLVQANLLERCALVGSQPSDTLPGWYRTMDVFIMPSRYENFSNAILEAMGCALPIIASSIGGNRMLVEEGRNGLLFLPGSWESLSATIIQMISSCDDWKSMGGSSRLLVNDQYNWETTVRVFENLAKSTARN